jgi:hypothetical protein
MMTMRHFERRRPDEPVASRGEQAPAQSFDDDFDEGSADGVSIDEFEPGTVLAVTTRNSRYRLTLLDREGHALITGGSLFADPTDVRIEGAALRGIIPKFGRILVGHQLELSIGNRLVTTSPVQSVHAIAA